MRKLKYILEELRWLKVLNSPFKPFKIKWYIGKTQVGTPYFLPRKWVKATPERAKQAALEEIKRREEYNKRNPDNQYKVRSFEELYQEKLKYRFAEPIKVGFDYCSLGWKTKWRDDDYRFEWSPIFTFVFFGYQIAMIISHDHPDQYWSSWLYYEYQTKGTKKERIEQCRNNFQQTRTTYWQGQDPVTRDYYEVILKPKYLKS
jgi:hypothetical protein